MRWASHGKVAYWATTAKTNLLKLWQAVTHIKFLFALMFVHAHAYGLGYNRPTNLKEICWCFPLRNCIYSILLVQYVQ